MSDDEGFGDLFGGEEAVPEYPLQTLAIDRLALADEGFTYEYFDPLLDRFDNIAPADTTAAAVEGQIAVLRQRLAALSPPPLEVKYRDKRHSLWGHKLWNAAKYIVKRMDERLIDVRGKAVIELGAGLGVPTLAAYKNGARLSVVTDYPDAELLDIIAMNVEANCAPGDVDADVKVEMESVARAQLSADGREPTPEQLHMAVSTRCIVEPLLWGKKEHIDKVMAYTTGGAGYDIVILSDILFNHVCNDDLADTLAALLAKNPQAAGYCVFSHHRAFKQLHDFEFFDKCVRRGLHYEQLDEQNYPMMFPEDRGPEEVRQPVKCYKITRRYDDAGFGLDASLRFDVVLQGTGMVQSILSAALARSGLKVLHCDGEDHYAGPMATFDDEGLVRYLETLKELTSCKDGSGGRTQPLPPSSLSLPCPQVVVNRMAEEVPAARRRRYLFDLLPLLYLARGPLLRKLAAAGLTGSLECQHVARFLFLSHGGATSSGEAATAAAAAAAMEVPLTRATVFGNTAVSLFDKRRLMRFVKDVEASLAEQLHAKTANPADDPSVANTSAAAADAEAAAAAIFTQAAAADPSVTLRGLLEKKYALTGTALEVASLMGMMDVLPRPSTSTMTDNAPCAGAGKHDGASGIAAQPPLMQSVDMERDVLLSTGAYNGKSPFLTTSYGAAEVPQCMCRTSAVWGGVFVLRRSLRGVAVDEEKETQFAVLSNGQWVPAKVIVTPAELAASYLTYGVQDWYYDVLHEHEMGRTPLIPLEAAGASASSSLILGVQSAAVDDDEAAAASASSTEDRVQLSRVVLATKTTPLFSWEALRAAQAVEVDEERDYTAAAPVLTALVREPTTQAVVWIVQQSFACDQAPPREMAAAAAQADQEGKEDAAHPVTSPAVAADPCVVHFTADAHELSQEQLYAYVQRFYVTGPKDAAAAAPAAAGSYSVPQDDIIFAAAFTLDSVAVAQCGVVADPVELPSETRWTHLFGWEESTKLRHANEHDRQHLLRQRASSSAAAAEAEEKKEKTTTEDGEGRERARPASPVTSAARAKEMCQASEHFRVVQVPSLLPNFVYDGHYMQAAEAAYQRTLGLLGLHAEGEAENTYGFLQPKPAE